MRILAFCLAIIFTGGGCSLFSKKPLKEPKVKLADVDVTNAGADAATLLFGFNVHNPNDFPLKADAVEYEIHVGEKPLSSGTIDEALEVPANADKVLSLPIRLKYADVFRSVSDLLGKGATSYRLKGKAKFGFLRIPFDEAGELKFEGGKLKTEKKK